LDPFGIRQIRDLILEQHAKGKTLFVSSHLLSEVEKFCTRIGIIYQGKLITEDSTATIIDSIIPSRTYRIETDDIPAGLVEKLEQLPFVQNAKIEQGKLMVSVDKDEDHRKALSNFLSGLNVSSLIMQEQTKTLEEAFLSITTLQKLAKNEVRND
jgi:ABC-type multidrug transport system ATPase subunit